MKRALFLSALLSLSACDLSDVPAFSQKLEAVTLETPGATFPSGSALQVKVWGHYNDGTKADLTAQTSWASSNPEIGTISPSGIVSLLAVGATRVTGTYEAHTVVATFFSTGVTVTGITLTTASSGELARGDTRRFNALATLSDGTQKDVTAFAAWTTDGAGTLEGTTLPGEVKAAAMGQGYVKASWLGRTGFSVITIGQPRLVSLTIGAPAGVVRSGNAFKLQGRALYSDGSARELDSAALWSGDDQIIHVDGDGTAHALATGSGRAYLQWNGSNASLQIVVSERVLKGLAFTATRLSMPRGLGGQAEVFATWDDGSVSRVTEAVQFSSSAPALVRVSNEADSKGQLSALELGEAIIEARLGDEVATLFSETGAPVLQQLQPTVQSARVRVGQTISFPLVGAYSDGTHSQLAGEVEVTHEVGVVTNGAGDEQQLTAVALGNFPVEYRFGGQRAEVQLEVVDVPVSGLEVRPVVVNGTVARFELWATWADGVRRDISELATWSTSSSAVQVSDVAGARGQLELAGGDAQILAIYDGQVAITSFSP